jgi:hypothetical protein
LLLQMQSFGCGATMKMNSCCSFYINGLEAKPYCAQRHTLNYSLKVSKSTL